MGRSWQLQQQVGSKTAQQHAAPASLRTKLTVCCCPAIADQPDAERKLETFLHSYPPGCPKLREFTATLCDVSSSDPAKFCQDLTAHAKQPNPGQPPKIVVAVPRIRAPQVVLEVGTPAQQAAVHAAASKHSLLSFQCFAQTLKEDHAKDSDQPILGECVCCLQVCESAACTAALLLPRLNSQRV
jgi:hypothetical protein